jgi:MEDS: MEthanogen/methylotroph, DcmR Sensory domain
VVGMRSRLWALGLDVAREVNEGGLILSSDQSHLEAGEFDVQRMLATLHGAVSQALADGYVGLWASGDMTWEMGGKLDLDKLLEYEYALEEFMKRNLALSGICQYHRDTLPPAALLAALHTHNGVSFNETLIRFNPHYQPHHTLTQRWKDDLAADQIHQMLDQLTN